MLDRLRQAQFFSKLVWKTELHRILIFPEYVEKTAFETKYGHFEFLVMPTGLRNAPATFETLINSICGTRIDGFVFIYLEDILVFSDTREDHLWHLRLVFSGLQENQLYTGCKKYEYIRDDTGFLGLIVGKLRINIGLDWKALIRD